MAKLQFLVLDSETGKIKTELPTKRRRAEQQTRGKSLLLLKIKDQLLKGWKKLQGNHQASPKDGNTMPSFQQHINHQSIDDRGTQMGSDDTASSSE